ncbi:IST1-like protein [Linum perenne]
MSSKTAAKMTVSRIKLLKNKRQAVVRQMRRDIALLLQSGQDATARIRVEHVIREQNVLAANEFIELFCELVVSRLQIIAKQRECPADLKEGIASLMFAAPRCSEIPELLALKDIFEKKYGTDFVGAAVDLRPSCGVNRMLIDKLSVRTPTGQVKLKVLKEIAKEHQIEWDTTESEEELLKPPEELIDGPSTFAAASSFPSKLPPSNSSVADKPTVRSTNEGQPGDTYFGDAATAADAAAKSAKQAIAAAQAAAYLANRESNQSSGSINHGFETHTDNSAGFGMPMSLQMDNPSNGPRMTHDYQSFNGSHYPSHEGTRPIQGDCGRRVNRRHSYNEAPPTTRTEVDQPSYRRYSYNYTRPVQENDQYDDRATNDDEGSTPRSELLFDESECDEEIEMEERSANDGHQPPPVRPPPPVPTGHHPKLPDYDQLAARFEALKCRKPKA